MYNFVDPRDLLSKIMPPDLTYALELLLIWDLVTAEIETCRKPASDQGAVEGEMEQVQLAREKGGLEADCQRRTNFVRSPKEDLIFPFNFLK